MRMNPYFKRRFQAGIQKLAAIKYAKSTRSSYASLMKSWMEFLDSSPPGFENPEHNNGVLMMDLQEGRALAGYLMAYLDYLSEEVNGKKRYAVTTYRGRMAAVIAFHRLAWHALEKLPLVWPAVKAFEAQHVPKEKGWLSLSQLKALKTAAWSLRNANPFGWVMRCVLDLISEPIYRIGNILPKNKASAHLCKFDWGCFNWYNRSWEGKKRRTLEIALDEKRNNRRVQLLGTPGIDRITNKMAGGSTFETAKMAKKKCDFDTGLMVFDGKLVTQDTFRSWLRETADFAGIKWEVDGVRKGLNPSDVRRSAILHMYDHVGPEKARYMIGHSSAETCKRFYISLTIQEKWELCSTIPWGAQHLLSF